MLCIPNTILSPTKSTAPIHFKGLLQLVEYNIEKTYEDQYIIKWRLVRVIDGAVRPLHEGAVMKEDGTFSCNCKGFQFRFSCCHTKVIERHYRTFWSG